MLRFVGMVAVVLGVMGAAPRAAEALTVQMPVSGIAVVGIRGGSGIWLGVQPWDGGQCQWRRVTSLNRLSENLDVVGTGGADYMMVARTTGSFICGVTWTPLNPNGRFVHLIGGPGDDTLIAGPGTTLVSGDDDNDTLYLNRDRSSQADGGPGNDRIFGFGWPDDTMFGDTGSDFLCAPHSSVGGRYEGGPQVDTRCGGATLIDGIEIVDCRACGF